jgi:PAS domain S-box-containing protein
MQLAGNAKLYYLSSRVPIADMLEFSPDPIVVLNEEHRIIQVNKPFLALLHVTRETVLGNRPGEIPHPLLNHTQFLKLLDETDSPSVADREIQVQLEGKPFFFRVKRVPAVFEDASRGVSFLIEDITGKKMAEARIERQVALLQFLARTSAELADMGDDEDIYQYMSDQISELESGAYVMVNSIDPDRMETRLRAFTGDEGLKNVIYQYFGDFLKGGVSMEKGPPEVLAEIAKGKLVPGPQGLYRQVYQVVPEHICNEVEERMGLGKRSYAMGCTCRMGIYGNIALLYRYENDIQNRETLEAFVRQAGVALQRRYMREKLMRAEEKIRMLEDPLSFTGSGKSTVLSSARNASGQGDLPGEP